MTDIPKQWDLDLTISIVNWNTRQDLLECLDSIIPEEQRETPAGTALKIDGLSAEVIVVDNGSQDASARWVSRRFPCVTVLPQRENLGYARGNNLAFAASHGRLVLVLNPDTLVSRGALAALVEFAESDQFMGIAGAKVLNPDGTLQYSARKFPTLAAGIYRHSILGRLFPDNKATREYLQSDWLHDDAREVDWVSGCAMLIKRETLIDVGGFDEDYYMYVEDVDICWRARKAGWTVWFCPYAVITHKKARASDLIPNRMILEHHKSMYRFFCKNYRPSASIFERMVTPVGIFARAFYFISRNKWRKWLKGAPRG